ncbi:hypothetical protein GJ744_008990 [Endocarpon pusillum]|uniref:Kinetochore protein SPC25 n=1 Tax=Endocarpon pusillum TaxID=364733 RepID=A0A8H7AGL1_9EURO|nr:hypothetical protein GJ744_008990 [Endocarpon pusillum]
MAVANASLAPSNPFSASASSRAAAPMSPQPNPLTQLPNVDFNFEELRQRMSAFTVKFDAFIERGRKRVLEERNEFRERLGELTEDQRLKSQSIATLSSATTTHRSLLAREQSEKEEMNTAIRSLENTHATHCKARDRLKSQIAQTQRQIDSKLQAQRDYNAKLESQSRLNGPELAFWETYLGVRLEGAGVLDRIKVVFTLEGGRAGGNGAGAGDREVWFELDLSHRDYEVRGMGRSGRDEGHAGGGEGAG